MEKIKMLINCVEASIKKNFFKAGKNDIYHGCEKACNFAENNKEREELNNVNEYIENYNVTTRWQTV